jgi:hypothetical protein
MNRNAFPSAAGGPKAWILPRGVRNGETRLAAPDRGGLSVPPDELPAVVGKSGAAPTAPRSA